MSMPTKLPARDLVLIGAGHTNLHVVRMWRMRPIPDVRLTVVSPFSRATYSGMLPGTLAGLYEPEQMEIDLYRFGASCGARVIVDSVTGFDPQRREVLLSNRAPLRYDVASIGIGSVPKEGLADDQAATALSIKPMATFRRRLEARLAEPCFANPSDSPPTVCIVGGGAAGIEITLCLSVFLKQRDLVADFHLIDSGDDVLKGYRPRTVGMARKELSRQKVTMHLGRRVVNYEEGVLGLSDNTSMHADLVIWASSAAPPPVLDKFDLPKAEDGFLAVRQTLQSVGDDSVFVVGDTATLIDNPLPKAGVYAVREGPILWENLVRTFRDQPAVPFRPQSGFLSLLSTGDGRALGEYKGVSFCNRLAWRWKDRIDRKFMQKYQDYRPPAMDVNSGEGGNTPQEPPSMRCRGCGGKVASQVLSAALARLNIPPSDLVAQGLDTPDDAAILNPNTGSADVVSVDFFQAFLDDPFFVGRVAAINALSDIWAVGADPHGALAMVSLPEGHPRQQTELLYQLLAGGQQEFAAAGVSLLGGHTTESEVLTIGYTVLGRMQGRLPLTKGNLRPGDRLILTKPLGTGVLLAAHAECRCRAQWMDPMLAHMLLTNRVAAQSAREMGVAAATDVTGFGLAGHLLEMLKASCVGAEISLGSLPLLDGFTELIADGIRSSLDPANRQSEDRMATTDAKLLGKASYQALFDPQTSGGLLIGIQPEKAEELLSRLVESGYAAATIIGTAVANSNQLTVRA